MGPPRDQKLRKGPSNRCANIKRFCLEMPAAWEKARCLLLKTAVLYHVYLVIYFNDVPLHFLISFFRKSSLKDSA